MDSRSTSHLAELASATFYVLAAHSPEEPVWALLLDVPIAEWRRLSVAFRPRKLFLYGLVSLYGCETGELHWDQGLSGQVNYDDAAPGAFYFTFGNRTPYRIPYNLARLSRRSSSTHQSGSRKPALAEEAKMRDGGHCVITGDYDDIEAAHCLPFIATPDEVEYFNTTRGHGMRQLAGEDCLANLLTLSLNAHKGLDKGRICLIPIPNRIMTLQDGNARDYADVPHDAIASWTARDEDHIVVLCGLQSRSISVPVDLMYPSGTKARINPDDPRYPPTWLLEIVIGRSMLISFAADREDVYHIADSSSSEGDSDGGASDWTGHDNRGEGDGDDGGPSADHHANFSGSTLHEAQSSHQRADGSQYHETRSVKRSRTREDRLDELMLKIMFGPLPGSKEGRDSEATEEERKLAQAQEAAEKAELNAKVMEWSSQVAEARRDV